MATYAPLFAHVEGWQWRPDMIWFDNLHSFNTASYYVQQLFSLNKGTHVLPLTMDKKAVTGADDQNGLFASAVWDKQQNEVIVKVVNTSDQSQTVNLNFDGIKKDEKLGNGKLTVFNSSDPIAENSIDNPTLIMPVESDLQTDGNQLNSNIGPRSFYLFKLRLSK